MDSMRSLNKSLPKTRRQPDVHQSFRTAALNVTNLYKSALADLDKARTDGYQEALDELLGFLDRENLGVGDGEGWRIRQWATERLDGALPRQSSSDSDDEYLDEKRARSSSPIMERSMGMDDAHTLNPVAEHRRDPSLYLRQLRWRPPPRMPTCHHYTTSSSFLRPRISHRYQQTIMPQPICLPPPAVPSPRPVAPRTAHPPETSNDLPLRTSFNLAAAQDKSDGS